jgi:hypothetical protein
LHVRRSNLAKAGSAANATVTASGALLAIYSTETESNIDLSTKYDWLTNFSGLSNDIKGILAEASAADIAMKIISYNMAGYGSKEEAYNLLNYLRDMKTRDLEILKDRD